MTTNTKERRCKDCPTILSIYNEDDICYACRKPTQLPIQSERSPKQKLCDYCTNPLEKDTMRICALCKETCHKARKLITRQKSKNFRIIIQKTKAVENPTPKAILQIVADAYGFSTETLYGIPQNAKILWARHLMAYLLCVDLEYSLNEATRELKALGCSEIKVGLACRKVTAIIEKDPRVRVAIDRIRASYQTNNDKAMVPP